MKISISENNQVLLEFKKSDFVSAKVEKSSNLIDDILVIELKDKIEYVQFDDTAQAANHGKFLNNLK